MKTNGEARRADNGGNRRPEEILAEIEQTRLEMNSTLTAIEHRLTPGQLVDQGLDYLRSSGANDFVQNLGGQVKNNPLPVTLVGIGMAWLMASSRNPKVSDGTQAVGERMRQARDSLSSASQSARQRIGELSDSARQRIDRARGGMDYMMREQPLALGAVGLAIGAVLAAMAPRTRQEDQLMGETRDQLMEKAKAAGQETVQKATEVAKKGIEQVKEATAPMGADFTPRGPGGTRGKP